MQRRITGRMSEPDKPNDTVTTRSGGAVTAAEPTPGATAAGVRKGCERDRWQTASLQEAAIPGAQSARGAASNAAAEEANVPPTSSLPPVR